MDQENSLKKGPWSVEEDQKLIDCVKKHGQGNWQRIPREAGLNRCGKSCRLRWTNYLKPGIKRGGFSDEEEATIISLHKTLGNKWSRIAAHLPRRTDNEIKNYWNTHLRKKLLRMGVDPKTHRQMPPDHHLDFLGLSQALNAASLLNMNVNPFDAAALTLQAANANDLIKIQILQNIMQLVNPSPLPYVQNSHAQFNRFPTGANSNFTNLDPMMPDFSSFSALLLNQQPPSSSNSFPWSQGEILPGPTVNDNVKGSGSAPGNINVNPEHSLPSLVSITPESSTLISPPESNQQSYISSTIQPDVFDAWENLVDEEADSSFWKNILG